MKEKSMIENWLAEKIILNNRLLYPLGDQDLSFGRTFEKNAVRLLFWAFKISDRWSFEKLSQFQLKRLKKLIRHIYNIPFWRERLNKAGIKDGVIESFSDFHKIPILTKRLHQCRLTIKKSKKQKREIQ